MSVIQKIRDKYARWAVIAIAISLLGFIMMDAFAGKTGLFNSSQSTTLAKVNGTSINHLDFEKEVLEQENIYKQRYPQLDESQSQQIKEDLYEQKVGEIVLNEEYEKLGLTVTDKELNDVLYGDNPPPQLKQQFSDPKTGQYNAVAAQGAINQMKKDPTKKDDIDRFLESVKNQRLMSKYMAMMLNTINFPKWFLEKRNIDNSLIAKISYINIPYATIPDSSIKVSDDEIKQYINNHKDIFEQKQETRSISYVLFNAAPSASDSGQIKKQLEDLKPQFLATTDPANFVAQQSSPLGFFDGYLSKSSIQISAKDSFLKLAPGAVYGPYIDANQGGSSLFVLAKMIDVKNLPDTVKCRHILIGTTDAQGQPIMSDSIAKAKVDSIALAIKNGASFDLLDSLYSTDERAKQDKGVMSFSSTQIQGENFAKEFGKFILFDGKAGDKKVLKTQIGWHYIEIMEQKNVQPHYKIAYVGKPIVSSITTDQDALNKANLFAGDSRDLTSFNENYDKNLKSKGINKLAAADISEMAYDIPGLQGSNRSLVKKIFETDKGDILGPERAGDNYVVAVVTEVNEPGLPNPSAVRMRIEPALRNKKKGEQIIKNIGKFSTLDEVSAKMKQPIQVADSLHIGGGQTLGYEPKVLGAAFNAANKGKLVPEPIAGTQGVYVMRIDNISTVPVESANIEEQRKSIEMQERQSIMSQMQQNGKNPIIETLKNAANIKDYRSKFY